MQKTEAPLEAHAGSEMHLIKCSDESIKDAETIFPAGNQKMFAKKHNYERLAIIMSIFWAGFTALYL